MSILIIVAFVIYPFAVLGVTAFIVSRSRRERFAIPTAKLFAVGACIVVSWFMFTYGLGKIPSVTIIGSAVFVFGIAATGGLFGAIADLFVPTRTNEPYPTSESVDEWDSPSLFSVTGYQAADRARLHGFDSLNEVERVLSCLFCFDGDVNNGGFGMWVGDTHPKSLLATVQALRTVGATAMACFVEDILSEIDGLARINTIDEWQEHFALLPETYDEKLESLSPKFLELEPDFLESAYGFARLHWQQVRTA